MEGTLLYPQQYIDWAGSVGTSPGTTEIDFAGWGFASTAAFGTPALVPATGAFLLFFIGGVDCTSLVEWGANPVKRSLTLSGGSKGTCNFVLNNRKGFHRPAQGEEVIILRAIDGTRFFAGVVDNISEYDYKGTAALEQITVNCVDYGALCDRRYVGAEYQHRDVSRMSQLFYKVASSKLADLGVQYVFTSESGQLSGDIIVNWQSVRDLFNQKCQETNSDWRIDFYKNLYGFTPDEGYAVAPFTIRQNDGNWTDMHVARDNSKYANRVGAKNSQNVNPLWTDPFTVASSADTIWVTMAPLNSKPIVKLNGAVQRVVAAEEIGSKPYDFYWVGYGIIRNAGIGVSAGDVITVTYPSPLSYVAWSEDAGEIATYGLFEYVFEVRDVGSLDELQALADAVLARKLQRPTRLTIQTDRDYLEPGMLLSVDLARPLVALGSYLITQVDSEEQGKQFFRNTVTAMNTASFAIDNMDAFLVNMLARTVAPRDRVTQHILFNLAETIPGITNPGLQIDADSGQQAVRTVPVNGYLSQCSLYFKSAETVLTDTDIVVDLLLDGVSIFPSGDSNKMVWPAGQTEIVVNLSFAAAPFAVSQGDVVHPVVIAADPKAMDGALDLAMLVS